MTFKGLININKIIQHVMLIKGIHFRDESNFITEQWPLQPLYKLVTWYDLE